MSLEQLQHIEDESIRENFRVIETYLREILEEHQPSSEPHERIVPVGTVLAYCAETPPDGYLLCDGKAYEKEKYHDLFTVIQYAWGNTNTLFHVPDLRGRFPRGWDNGAGNDPDASSRTALYSGDGSGDHVGSSQADATALPTTGFTTDDPGVHRHTVGSSPDFVRTGGSVGGQPTSTGVNPGAQADSGAHTHTVTGGGDNETRPENVYVNYIIKY